MQEIAFDSSMELLVGIGYAIGTVLLTVLGVEAELMGVQTIGTDPVLAVWFAAAGSLALFVGLYQVGYERLTPIIADTVR